MFLFILFSFVNVTTQSFFLKFKANAVWHFACMPFIWLCSAAFGAVRQTWCTSRCWCSWRCLTRLFKGQVRLLIRVPSSVFKSQHSGARIAHESFKMLTMWIISCTKVTGHVTSGTREQPSSLLTCLQHVCDTKSWTPL